MRKTYNVITRRKVEQKSNDFMNKNLLAVTVYDKLSPIYYQGRSRQITVDLRA